VVSRLTWQKGMDVLARCLDHLVGDRRPGWRCSASWRRRRWRRLIHRGRSAPSGPHRRWRIGYDEALSTCMQAGGGRHPRCRAASSLAA
jgi:starch synthase